MKKRLDEKILSVLKIPTVSRYEYIIRDFIKSWAKINNIKCIEDSYNNLYLIKGTLNNDEYYPCVTAHMDTVHKKHIKYIEENKKLPLKLVKTNNKVKVYCNKFGVGGDNKCGISIALFLLQKVPKLKVTFFSNEELGMKGSNNLNKNFFNDIGYVISFDSPEGNRAACSCNQIRLFSDSFYVNKIKKICDAYGFTNFFNEPFTDIINIKKYINVECMIFGSGYYLPHSDYEFVILNDVKNSAKFGKALIEELKFKRYLHNEKFPCKVSFFAKKDDVLKTNINLLIEKIKR